MRVGIDARWMFRDVVNSQFSLLGNLVDHTKMMDAALTRASRPHETVIVEGADHYFRDDDHLRTVFTRLGAFLDTQLWRQTPFERVAELKAAVGQAICPTPSSLLGG